jgi:hypothetical protein
LAKVSKTFFAGSQKEGLKTHARLRPVPALFAKWGAVPKRASRRQGHLFGSTLLRCSVLYGSKGQERKSHSNSDFKGSNNSYHNSGIGCAATATLKFDAKLAVPGAA